MLIIPHIRPPRESLQKNQDIQTTPELRATGDFPQVSAYDSERMCACKAYSVFGGTVATSINLGI